MSATKSGAQRGARVVSSNTIGCMACKYYQPTVLFTLCTHRDSMYKIGEVEDFHTIQHMRDDFVGLCGDDMKLQEV